MNSTQAENNQPWIIAYNLIPSFFWSALNLIPIFVFCDNMVSIQAIILFSIISLLPVFISHAFLQKLQLANTIKTYKNLGVPFINNFTQNGHFVNWLIRKKKPNYKVVSTSQQSFEKLLRQTFLFEKFHLMLFLFFCMTTVEAILKNHYIWVLILIITNLAYNIYPILLQQYLRVRLKALQKAASGKTQSHTRVL